MNRRRLSPTMRPRKVFVPHDLDFQLFSPQILQLNKPWEEKKRILREASPMIQLAIIDILNGAISSAIYIKILSAN